MEGIAFGNGRTWLVQGWAFRQLLQDLRADPMANASLLEVLDDAENLGMLLTQALDEPLRRRVVVIIKSVSQGILDGTRASGLREAFPDAESEKKYREGLARLLELADQDQ